MSSYMPKCNTGRTKVYLYSQQVAWINTKSQIIYQKKDFYVVAALEKNVLTQCQILALVPLGPTSLYE